MENKAKTNKYLSWFIIILLLVIGLVWWQLKTSTIEYSSDTEIEIFNVPVGETVVFKNGATVTVKGDATIDGQLHCQDGSLSLVVEGKLTVRGQLKCALDDELDEGDFGNGMLLVAKGEVEFTDSAVVQTNGHLQLVDDATKLALNQESLEAIFNDAGDDSGEGFRIGPMVPIDLAEGQAAFNTIWHEPIIYPKSYQDQSGLVKQLVKVAQAQVPATDMEGNPVNNTVRIGGLWVVGTPVANPPGVIDIPTPPKGIKKIIVTYNFGSRNIALDSLILWGPDGRPGADATSGCNLTGDNGQHAFRLNVTAPNVTISRLDLHLGNGGNGGAATTDKDCDPGKALGGNGAEAGNFKIRGSNSFQITDYFDIYPGRGGAGGIATAYGKDGKIPKENGGDATAIGGVGADNKKGAKVTGSVSGLDNVTIHSIVAGRGGDAMATGGRGGDGKGCKSDGGNGGQATATAGVGGQATSRTAESIGGDGGDATATGGRGGDGGDCDPKDDGGNAGHGGNAKATPGLGGTGKTTRGSDGFINGEAGGEGGEGGDGCLPGKGGNGGNGSPQGAKGKDGKNLCILVQDQPLTDPTPPGEQTDPNPGTGGVVAFNTVPTELVKMHLIGTSPCPDPFVLSISGGDGSSWTVEGAPQWISVPTSGSFGSVPISFNCNITNFTTHIESATLYFSSGGESLALPVTLNVNAQ